MRNAAGKRAGPVEAVIAWAWREELPKAPKMQTLTAAIPSSWRSEVSVDYSSGGATVNLYGCVPDFSADAMPHPDARLIGEAVFALDKAVLEMPEDWRPAPELDRFGGLGTKAVADAWRRMTREEDGRTVLRLKPSDLVIRRAVLGWDGEGMQLGDVTLETESNWNGKARWFLQQVQHRLTGRAMDGIDETVPTLIEVDGVDKHGHPKPGAYRKHYLDPDPVGAIIARAEHEIWLSCLAMVMEACDGKLVDTAMLPSDVPAMPWLDAPEPMRRELTDLTADARIEESRKAQILRRYPRWLKLFGPVPAST